MALSAEEYLALISPTTAVQQTAPTESAVEVEQTAKIDGNGNGILVDSTELSVASPTPVTFLDRAKIALHYGIPVVPALPRQKATIIGSKEATTNLAVIEKWNQDNPNYNSCLVAQAKIGGVWILDCDSPEVKQQIEKDTGKKLPETFAVSSSSAGHRYFRQNEESLKRLRNFSVHRGDKEFFSVRFDNMYCVGPLSIHPSGAIYKVVRDVEPVEAPSWLIDWLLAQAEENKLPVTASPDGPVIPRGSHDNELTRIAGKLRGAGMEEDSLTDALIEICEKRCENYGSDYREMCQKIAHSICKKPAGDGSIPFTDAAMQRSEQATEANKQREDAESFRKLVESSKAVKLIAYLSAEDAQEIEQQQQPIRIQIETPKLITTFGQVVADPAAPAMLSDIPITAIASTRLGDIYSSIFEPNGWPLNYALPALVTAASVLVPRFVVPEGQILIGDDNLTNLYTALIGKVHAGKSQCIEWAARALGIYHEDCAEHYIDLSAGSAEQLIDALDKRKNVFKNSVLIDQDEWAQLFAKADIPNATFPAFLTKSFYRRRQIFTRPRGKEVVLNLAMSFCGGIVEDDFDSVFNALTLGGCYDRFLFGRMPQDWAWSYRPFPRENASHAMDELLAWEPIPVFLDGSVFEVGQAWAKQNPELGRVIEICIRIATIFASMDGRSRVTGKDLEVLSGLAAYQLDLRRQFQPNAGQNADAQFANAALRWINRHAGEWTSIALLKKGVHSYEQKLGPNVAERALLSMARGGQIDLWLNKAEPVVLPTDYRGPVPRIGMVRRAKVN